MRGSEGVGGYLPTHKYRCDMGDGKFALMKDLSSPIFVRGRHWGSFRMDVRQG